MGMGEKVIVIIGPTAVGKTKLSVELAKTLNGEIISGDSMQIYKGMDIGTAKIKEEEKDGIPHHLIDIIEPDESYSVAQFQKSVRELISKIHKRGKMPIIVGGTGLYIQSVLYDYQFSEKGQNEQIRIKLDCEAQQLGNDYLYKKLQEVDPKSAELIHPNNVRRVIRALEVYESTGIKFSEAANEREGKLLYDVALVGLTMDRDKLYERINMRVDIMLEEGLLQEVKNLYNIGINDCQSIQAIGYKELYSYLDGNISFEEAVQQLKQNSRRYAKRQLTWFRNKMEVTWFDMTEHSVEEKLSEILTFVAGKLQLEANIKHYRD